MEQEREIAIRCLEDKKAQLNRMMRNPKIMGAPALVHFIRPQIMELKAVIDELKHKSISELEEDMSEETVKWIKIITTRPTIN